MELGLREKIFLASEFVVGIVGVVSNAVVLAAIVKTSHLHTVANLFIANLALADIAVGILVAPLVSLSWHGLPRDYYGCVLVNCLILQLTNVSILMLLTVAVERFVAIKQPYFYERIMSRPKAMVINAAVWILGSTLGFVPFLWNTGFQRLEECSYTTVITLEFMVYFQFFGLVLAPLFIMACIYIYIVLVVHKYSKGSSKIREQLAYNIDETPVSCKKNDSETPKQRKVKKDAHAAKLFGMLMLAFVICWLPINIFYSLALFCRDDCVLPTEALLVAITMSHANSSVNPYLYAASNSQISAAIKQMLGCKVKPSSLGITPSIFSASQSRRFTTRISRVSVHLRSSSHSVDPPHYRRSVIMNVPRSEAKRNSLKL